MHVHVNAAVSADGKLSTRRRDRVTISGPTDFDRVDEIRRRCDGILVGVGTVLADDPQLDGPDDGSSPARVVADSRGRTPVDAEILDDTADTYLLVSKSLSEKRRDQLMTAGATLITTGDTRVDVAQALPKLAEHGIEYLLAEGGGELLFSLFDAGVVDELSLYVGPMIIGGRNAPTLVDGEGFVDTFPELTLKAVEQIDEGVRLYWEV